MPQILLLELCSFRCPPLTILFEIHTLGIVLPVIHFLTKALLTCQIHFLLLEEIHHHTGITQALNRVGLETVTVSKEHETNLTRTADSWTRHISM